MVPMSDSRAPRARYVLEPAATMVVLTVLALAVIRVSYARTMEP